MKQGTLFTKIIFAVLLVALLAYLVLRKNRYDENHLTQKVKVQA